MLFDTCSSSLAAPALPENVLAPTGKASSLGGVGAMEEGTFSSRATNPSASTAIETPPKEPSDLDAYREELKAESVKLRDRDYVLIVARGKNPQSTMGSGWQDQRITTEKAAELIDRCHLPTLGVLNGPDSGVGDIDIDGDDERKAFLELFDNNPPAMPTCCTGRPGGERRIFAFNGRLAETGKVTIDYKAEDGSKVTLRIGKAGKGCQSIWPPSFHYDSETGTWSGARYTWLTGQSIHEIDPPELPEAVIDKLLAQVAQQNEVPSATNPNSEESRPASISTVVEAMVRHTRNMEDGADGSRRLFTVCCRAVEFDLSESDALEAVRQYESNYPFPRNYSAPDILRRLHDAAGSAGVERGSALLAKRSLTDLGNGERFADRYGTNARYIAAWKKWFIWNGRCWEDDKTEAVMRLGKQTATAIYGEATKVDCKEEQKAICNHARLSQSLIRLNAMLSLAKSEIPIATTSEEFDTDPWLLNCENGTIDLKKGGLLPHNPDDLITKTTGIDYADNPNWEAPLWLNFLNQIFEGDSELIEFVQRLMGYALVGEQTEHILPIFWGDGANGKSVFVGAIQNALGEYAMTAASGLFTIKRHDSHPTELADLHGKRLAVLNETSDGARLNEGLVKSITGGDKIRVRRMREDFWEFQPSHLPILVTNHKPIIAGTDNGIWRRLRLVPFAVTIPPEEQDKLLPEKLKAEAPGILRWMVEGCLAWQKDGLGEPKAVMAATESYKSESDTFGIWFQECCEANPSCHEMASDLLHNYNEWARRVHESEQSQVWLSKRLVDKGFEKTRTNKGVKYDGINLLLNEFKTQ